MDYLIIALHGFFIFMGTFGFLRLIEKFQRWRANRGVLQILIAGRGK